MHLHLPHNNSPDRRTSVLGHVKNYVEGAMPAHVLTIGTPNMVDAYRQLGLSFSSSSITPPNTNYLAQSNMINGSIVDILRGTPGVEKVDTRLLNLTIAEGIVKTQLVEGQIVFPTYLGSSQILVIGIDPNQQSATGTHPTASSALVIPTM